MRLFVDSHWTFKMILFPVFQDNAPYGLVVVPGRELADQIGAAAEDLCYSLGLRVRVLKGGQVISRDIL